MNETNNAAAELDLDDLLDSQLEDFEDLPDFAPYPAGTHKVVASLSMKEVNNKVNIELSMKAVETLELVHPTKDQPLVAGAQASTLFNPMSEFGRGALKKTFAQASGVLGVRTTRELISSFQEIECIVVTSVRKDKNDADKLYTSVKELAIVE